MPSPDTLNKRILLPLLASIVAITPLAIDLYLPAMLVIANDLQTTMPNVQISLSIYLAGYALGMLFFGPIADELGRRLLAKVGLALFGLSSLALAFCHNIELFWSLRAVQAFTGAAATVVVPGIIRHIYRENTAKGMSYVSMIMMVAPLIAPTLGSLIMGISTWQVIFLVLAAYSFAILALVQLYLIDIPIFKSQQRGLALFFNSYKTVFSRQSARADIASSMFASFAFFCFLTSVPYVYLDFFKVDEQLFGILFAFNVLALMFGNFMNTRLVPRLGSRKLLFIGLGIGFASGSALLLFSLMHLSLYFIVASIAPLMMSLGIVASNADSLILMQFEEKSGTATAVIGTLRFGSGALVGPILAFIHPQSAVPFSAMMFSALILILLVQLWHRKLDKKNACL
ncbi:MULTISPECIES: multidrug effflux MFS transporter [Pseudoalteromonas]|jgi:DHA1 family bicyclomycin/chloramphenicol resistance-like MFS transporter|uniref:Bcr/CflA family efflux transporter n=1 Tax=Pseudoalteromonas lipolytica TaxID=570156 RepID=A0AAD0S082_9GAMM|nr:MULTISPECIES: multidrug effflux MFS transporter [Pseudoalteromonas]AXV65567.1 Bcr/CflA family efflux MFS transporter [Pseudoalteromonas donghaensis]EWH06864.1 major facilitator transporter [Pseudoalteromonas lipolytica SCSIO 04301]MAE02242.1 Bcr/CflA family drug resistance efflux transporter [Pseudoalteromonas sp.]MBE0349887.1 MFS transporter, DHA1 family, bicyclomycin/chloramphenicol resistance protein [Pseudoalteromonas lipolytica LMEB 39]MCC9659069.1 multidrug effflux MFS transporter [Ps|tara:strand:- start:264 stop:1463 length:1200 start_codon:yes stop_codon:yes gene_type:complete